MTALRPDDAIEEVLDGRDHLAEDGGGGGKPAWHEHPVVGTVDLDDFGG